MLFSYKIGSKWNFLRIVQIDSYNCSNEFLNEYSFIKLSPPLSHEHIPYQLEIPTYLFIFSN